MKDLFLLLVILVVAQTAVGLADNEVVTDLDDSATEIELADNDMAEVVTGGGRSEDCLAAVAVNTIDGEQTTVPASGFLIEPGVHTLNGRATLDTTHCPIDREYKGGPAPDLEVNFETGRVYYIAYDHKPENPLEWRLFFWKMEL